MGRPRRCTVSYIGRGQCLAKMQHEVDGHLHVCSQCWLHEDSGAAPDWSMIGKGKMWARQLARGLSLSARVVFGCLFERIMLQHILNALQARTPWPMTRMVPGRECHHRYKSDRKKQRKIPKLVARMCGVQRKGDPQYKVKYTR